MKLYEIETNGETVQYVEIELSEGHFTSMTKAEYDRRQAAQSTPSIPEGGN